VFAPQDTPDEPAEVRVDDVVVRRLTGVPEVQPVGEEGTSGEEHHPPGSAELGGGDVLPREPTDFVEHGHAAEAVDRVVLARRFGEDVGIEEVAPERRTPPRRVAARPSGVAASLFSHEPARR
jgi:hypothetical protein